VDLLKEEVCWVCQVLRQGRVVGMTTCGAAKYRQLLQRVHPRIVVVEEAAEVLESHVVTTLSHRLLLSRNRLCQKIFCPSRHFLPKSSTFYFRFSRHICPLSLSVLFPIMCSAFLHPHFFFPCFPLFFLFPIFFYEVGIGMLPVSQQLGNS